MLDSSYTFLNHGAFGATLRAALESKRLWLNYIESQPVRFIDRELFPHMVNVSRGLADILDCRAQDLLPMPNATTALNTVVKSWQKRFKPGPGQRFLAYSVAYGSTKRLLRKVAEDTGAAYDEATVEFPLESEGPLLDALERALRPETSLIVLDAMPSNAPFVLPVEEAIALCRKKSPGAFIIVDAAHGLGGFTFKLRKHPADAVFTNCHKWFCGPKGTALLHVPSEHQSWVEPLVISHGFGADYASGFYWAGLQDYSSWLALDTCLDFWDAISLETAQLHNQYLAVDVAEMLSDAWGTKMGIPAELLGPMALVELPELPAFGPAGENGLTYEHAEAVQNSLFRRSIEVPVKALSGKLYVRTSSHIYNCTEDYEVLRDAVLDLQNGLE